MDGRLEMIQHEEIICNLSREWELMFFKAMKPRLYIDGDKWCCLYGESIQSGVCGFGSTPYDAIVSFNKAMHTQTKADA